MGLPEREEGDGKVVWIGSAHDQIVPFVEDYIVGVSSKIRDLVSGGDQQRDEKGRRMLIIDERLENKDGTQLTLEPLTRIAEWVRHHAAQEPPEPEKPLRSNDMHQVCDDPWDADFVDALTRQQLYELILNAQILGIKSLVALGCAKIAALIKGQPIEQIRQILAPNPQ